ncbi:MAG: methyl-accepting chemotaxis protein, partial [Nitrospirota bacterium]
MSWKDFKVSTKIIVCFAIPIALMLGIGVWTFQVSQDVEMHSVHTRDESVEFALLAQQMQKNVIQIQQWLTDIGVTRAAEGLDDGFDEAEKHYDSFMAGLGRFRSMYEKENDKEGLKTLHELKIRVDDYYAMGRKMADGYIKVGTEEGNKLMGDFDTTAQKLDEAMSPFVKEQIEEMHGMIAMIISSVDGLKGGVVVACIIAFAIAFLSGLFLARSINSSLKKAMGFAANIAEGDLTAKVDLNQKDEFGMLADTLNGMVERLKEIVGDVKIASDNVASGSQQMSASSEEMSQGANEQASSAEEASSSMEEMSANIRQNADNAQQTEKIALKAADDARD